MVEAPVPSGALREAAWTSTSRPLRQILRRVIASEAKQSRGGGANRIRYRRTTARKIGDATPGLLRFARKDARNGAG